MSILRRHFEESIAAKERFLRDEALLDALEKIVDKIHACIKSGKKLMTAGNGGSAADAQHFAAEFVGKYKEDRRPYPAVALTTDTSILTAWSNDHDFESVFERKVHALGQEGDVLVVFSTSGNSPNIVRAIGAAHEKGIHTVALLGKDGGAAKGKAHYEIIVPHVDTPRIQEVHVLLLHIIAEEVEKRLVRDE